MKIREAVRNFELPKIDVALVHGEADIVLKNVKTGLVERIHNENTFQANVLRDQFKNMPDIKQNPLNNGTFSGDIQKAFAGGLFLFRDAIEVGKYFMPAGNKMVGCGAKDVTNTELPTELGTYNSVESSEGNTTLTRVWDFATHQSNGTIGCICLTSGIAGYGGYGNPSGVGRRSEYSIRQYLQSGSAEYWHHAENGMSYYFQTLTSEDTRYLRVSKRRNLSNVASVFAGKSTFENIEITSDLALTGWNYWDDVCFAYYVGNGKFHIVPRTNGYYCASGDTFYYWEYDVSTETLSRKSFTNSSNASLTGGYYYSYHGSFNHPVFTRDGSIIIADGGLQYAYIIRLSDGEVMHKTSFIACNQYMGNRDFYAGQISSGLYVISKLYQESGNPSLYNPIIFIDTVNGTEYPSNWFPCQANMIPNDFDGTGLCTFENNLGQQYLGYNPLHLTTINNLQNPVTKTAAQTMKVTYTLTEV